MKQNFRFFFLFSFFILGACAHGHCNKFGNPQRGVQTSKVFIYKYDGSKQCDEKEGVSLESMEKELKELKVYSKGKRSDGQIRVQVCGALTGTANVYEIKLSDLSLAEALGFKKWDF